MTRFIGNDDVNMVVLSLLPGDDLISVCKSNKYFNDLCHHNTMLLDKINITKKVTHLLKRWVYDAVINKPFKLVYDYIIKNKIPITNYNKMVEKDILEKIIINRQPYGFPTHLFFTFRDSPMMLIDLNNQELALFLYFLYHHHMIESIINMMHS